MTKNEQRIINEQCVNNYKIFCTNVDEYKCENVMIGKQLRSCSAVVYETERYYFLKSYNTIVAFIDKYSGILYDVLRYVYGYTSTSAQHISKFAHDYSSKSRKTYRGI